VELRVLWLSVLWLSVLWLSVVWPTSDALVVVVGLLVAGHDLGQNGPTRGGEGPGGSHHRLGGALGRRLVGVVVVVDGSAVVRVPVRSALVEAGAVGFTHLVGVVGPPVRGLGELEAVAAERGVEDGGHRAGQVAELHADAGDALGEVGGLGPEPQQHVCGAEVAVVERDGDQGGIDGHGVVHVEAGTTRRTRASSHRVGIELLAELSR
jgi:hypothetical protein